MCLAIVRPKGKQVKKKWLRNGFQSNDDGAGFAYAEDGVLHIERGFFTFKTFYKAYRKHPNVPMLIHFRWKTSGCIDVANCHPWPIGEEFAVIHNGVIGIDTSDDRTMSDTGHFVNHVMAPILSSYPGAWDSGAFKYLVETSVGRSNKLAVINKYGAIKIFNEGEGKWDEGCWFSNDGYKHEYWGASYEGGSFFRGYSGHYQGSHYTGHNYHGANHNIGPKKRWNHRKGMWEDVDEKHYQIEGTTTEQKTLGLPEQTGWEENELLTREEIENARTEEEMDEQLEEQMWEHEYQQSLRDEIDRLKADGLMTIERQVKGLSQSYVLLPTGQWKNLDTDEIDSDTKSELDWEPGVNTP